MLPAQRTPVITRASVCPTSESPCAPAPGDTGADIASSVTTDNRETQGRGHLVSLSKSRVQLESGGRMVL